jgi:hypothetical protein
MTETVKLEIFVPELHVNILRDELANIGVGKIGQYDHCSSVSRVNGSWRPLPGSNPFEGEIGRLEVGEECRLEMNCPRELVPEALEVVRRVHPYETPLVNIVPLLNHLF